METYFFYNLKTADLWQADEITGIVVASLDGTLTIDEIVDIIASNNLQVPRTKLAEHFLLTLHFLLEKGFIYECN